MCVFRKIILKKYKILNKVSQTLLLMDIVNNNEDNKIFQVLNHYWFPIKDVINKVENFCIQNNYKNILEIGPGKVPFSLSTKTIGYNEYVNDYIELDIDINKLPFQDKAFDFVYSRHTLEDIQNPDFCMNEIIRISNSGYIETPSPLIEVTKGVDALNKSCNYAGYIHHRYIIWSDIDKCEIHFLPKYSCIIDNYFEPDNDIREKMYNIINNYPIYWNNYFIWKDKTPKIIIYKNGVNFGVKNHIVDDYISLIYQAIDTSIKNTEYFCKSY